MAPPIMVITKNSIVHLTDLRTKPILDLPRDEDLTEIWRTVDGLVITETTLLLTMVPPTGARDQSRLMVEGECLQQGLLHPDKVNGI